jgi:cobalt-zinc-cadmium efflux system membrane fusion protein
MSTNGKNPTILVVDDDEVLGQVLARVLTREGRTVLRASNAAQALQLADQQPPQLALVDLCLPDVDGVELAKSMRSNHADVPLILMTAYPLRLRDHPEMAGHFTRILTKPLNLQELRQAVDASMDESGAKAARAPLPLKEERTPILQGAQPAALTSPPPQQQNAMPPAGTRKRFKWVSVAMVVLALIALTGTGAVFTGIINVPGLASAETIRDIQAEPPPKVELVKGMENTLEVPKETQQALGILKDGKENVAIAQPPTRSRPLVLPGSTLLDTTRLTPIRIRFAPAEVIDVGTTVAPEGTTSTRELRSGDKVWKKEPNGDPTLLAVLWSVDVGAKKNDLVDALVQLELDKDVLERAEKTRGSVPEVFYLNALRNVRADENAIDRAESTLRAWRIPEKDIEAVREEAKRLGQHKGQRDALSREKQKAWPRVELRTPGDGLILERNISQGTVITDNTANLFIIGQVGRLLVTANAHEDDLPTLQSLSDDQRHWTIRTVGADSNKGIETPIDDISYIIDPNQHTAVVKGHIENPKGLLRGGQYVTATINLPPPKDVVEVPETALVTQGKQTVLFVQPDPSKARFTLRRVKVINHLNKVAWVKSEIDEEDQKGSKDEKDQDLLPLRPLLPGERVLASGTLELKAALEDEQSKVRKSP